MGGVASRVNVNGITIRSAELADLMYALDVGE